MNLPPPKAIVLVDDEKSYNDLMTQLLAENLKCPVHGFTQPLEALKALPTIDAAVIVTDYFMPEINGIEFIRRAASIAPHASFVMISGNNLAGEKNQLAKLPALKGLLAKPFGWRTLADEVIRVWPPETQTPWKKADAASP